MKKIFSIMLILAVLINTAGCGPEWQKKFIRKKKEVVKRPRIWQGKKYSKEPTEGLYSKHYNYAISWLSELLDGLGDNNKKDLRCIEEALGQVESMQYCLVQDKAKELDKHINRIREVRDIIKSNDLSQANKDYVRNSVDREERILRSEFYYKKIRDYMKKSFEEDEEMPDMKEVKR